MTTKKFIINEEDIKNLLCDDINIKNETLLKIFKENEINNSNISIINKILNLSKDIYQIGYFDCLNNFKRVVNKKYKRVPNWIMNFYNLDKFNTENHL